MEPFILSMFKNRIRKKEKLFYLNTNSIFDIASGSYLPGISNTKTFHKGQHYLNGGLAPLNGIIGTEQTFKSSIGLSFLSRVLKLYKDSCGLCYDSEFAIPNEERIINMSDDMNYGHKIEDRLILKDKSDYDMDGFFNLLKEIAFEREKHMEELLVETPFVNLKTNESYLTPIPFIIIIDSFSLMQSYKELDMVIAHDLSAKEQNMIPMMDGKSKSQFVRQLPLLAHKGGLHIILTAHITTKVQINPFERSKKDLQFMKTNDTTRGTGKQFRALLNILLETRTVKSLQDSKKESQYPDGSSSNVELSEINSIICRNKNNESGTTVPLISSQKNGIQASLGYYHYLINNPNKGFGMDHGIRSSKLLLKPNVTLSRHSVRKILKEDYEITRAVEILGQLCYLKNWWNISNSPELEKLSTMEIKDICEKLVNNKSIPIKDILNTRGYWTYDKKDKRSYMSVIDILSLI